MRKRTKKILVVFLTGVLLLGLAACGGGEEEQGDETGDETQVDETLSGETLTAGEAADHVFSLAVDLEKSLNPITTRSTLNQLVDGLVYDRLFEVDENFNVTSRILEDWYYSKNEGANGTWILKVRQGIKMHDGSELSAEDIAYSISRVFTSGSTFYQSQMGTVYTYVYHDEIYLSGEFDNGLLPQRLSVPIIKSVENSIKENVPVGSGPYTFSEDLSCLEKFDDYEDADSLPLDTIYLRPYTDPESLITEYESALVDLVLNDTTSIYNMGYGGVNERRYYPTNNMHFICFNSESPFFQFDAYRYAMNWIIDRKEIAETNLEGALTPSALPIHPNSPLFDQEANDKFTYDPARFVQELEKGGCRDLDGDGMLEYALSGVKNEIELNFVVCADNAAKVQAARKIAQDMEDAGVTVHLRELTWSEYLTALEGPPDEDEEDPDPNAVDWTWDMYYGEVALGGDWNTLTLFSGDREEDGTQNYGNWDNAQLEQTVYDFIGAKDEDRPAAEDAMLLTLEQSSVFVPIGFEIREVISHLGVIRGLEPNQYNPVAGVSGWTIKLD